jgi:cysteinyl-tRNA synthetase
LDLIFPHHENEIAQSETCFDKPFAKYWVHNGLTRFNTKKISKSDTEMAQKMQALTLGNLLSKFSGELLRFFVLSTQYRRPIEFSDEEVLARKKGLDSFYRLFERIERVTGNDPYAGGPTLESSSPQAKTAAEKAFVQACLDHQARFLEAMDDDFNTGGAVGVLFELATTINRFIDEAHLETGPKNSGAALAGAAIQTLRSLAAVLGLFEKAPTPTAAGDTLVNDLMEVLIALRAEARKKKQYELADMVRERLTGIGITLEDRPDGTCWRRAE